MLLFCLLLLVISQSGANQFEVEYGFCTTSDNCFQSPDYPSAYGNYNLCSIKVLGVGAEEKLYSIEFNTEKVYDKLTIGEVDYSGTEGPNGVAVSTGANMTWSSDGSESLTGFQVCLFSTCSYTDGTRSNDAACQCGSTTCHAETGFICTSSTNTCQFFLACRDDGTIPDDAACKCGNTTCNAETGFICDSSTNQCSASPCEFTNGDMNDAACKCGSTTCNAETGLFCTSSTNTCQLEKTCTLTDGTTPNDAACTCGSTPCNAETGLFCTSSSNTCTLEKTCTLTDGSAANTGTCLCGSTRCNAETGLICYSTVGGGSCRKTDVGNFGYPMIDSGQCTDVVNRVMISDKATCEAAATSMGLSDVTGAARYLSSETNPPGCFWTSGGALYHNTLSASTQPCSIPNNCLCLAVPNCPQTDGTTPNDAACQCGSTTCNAETGFICDSLTEQCSASPCEFTMNNATCKCGSTTCNAETGLTCDSSTNQCSASPCEFTNGDMNNAMCKCGSTTCNAETGLFCRSSTNTCTLEKTCTLTDGSAANTGTCLCGSTRCNVETGLICYSTVGGGSCRKTDVGTFGYLMINSGQCTDVVNRVMISDKATCMAAATSMGLSDKTAVSMSSLESPPGCLLTGGLYYNTLDGHWALYSAKKPCSNDRKCLCVAASNCPLTDGSAANTGTCLCGSTLCNEETGFICDSSTNQCSASPCKFTNGDMNDAACKCGSTLCNAETGLFCTPSTNTCQFSPTCTQTDGTTPNDAACTCGSTRCNAETGLFCTSSTNTCHWFPKCTHTDGTTPNDDAKCQCGTTRCNAETGFVCDSSINKCGKLCVSGWNKGCFYPSTEGCSIRDMSSCSAAELITIKTLYNNREQC